VNSGRHNRTVNFGKHVTGCGVRTGYDLHNVFKGVNFITRINPLRRVSDRKIPSQFQSGFRLQDRNTDLFGGPRINGGFKDNAGIFLQIPPNRRGSALQWAQVGDAVIVYGGRDGYNYEPAVRKVSRVIRISYGGLFELGSGYFQSTINPGFKLFYPVGFQVKSDNVKMGGLTFLRHRSVNWLPFPRRRFQVSGFRCQY